MQKQLPGIFLAQMLHTNIYFSLNEYREGRLKKKCETLIKFYRKNTTKGRKRKDKKMEA